MCFFDLLWLPVLIRFPLGFDESGHLHSSGMLPDLRQLSPSLCCIPLHDDQLMLFLSCLGRTGHREDNIC